MSHEITAAVVPLPSVVDLRDLESEWERDDVRLHLVKPDLGEECILRFGEIEQVWLQDLARTWVRSRLTSVKGRQMPQEVVRRSITLSTFLTATRADRGVDPTKLNAIALVEFDVWLSSNVSEAVRKRVLVILGSMLRWCHASGHLDAIGLSPTFIPSGTATPAMNVNIEKNLEDRRLPDATFAFLLGIDGLDLMNIDTEDSGLLGGRTLDLLVSLSKDSFQGSKNAMAVRLQASFGRRTEELLQLTADKLAWIDDKPCIYYDNFKIGKERVFLPIDTRAAADLNDWITQVRTRFPNTPDSKLAIFPAAYGNPAGTKTTNNRSLATPIRRWLRLLEQAIVAAKLSSKTGIPLAEVLALRTDQIDGSQLHRFNDVSVQLDSEASSGVVNYIESRFCSGPWLFPDPYVFDIANGSKSHVGIGQFAGLGDGWATRAARYEAWGIPGERSGRERIRSEDVRFIRFRHTYLQHCINAGVDIHIVSKLAGHTNISTTINNYIGAEMDDLREAEQKLSRYRLDRHGNVFSPAVDLQLLPSRPMGAGLPTNDCTDAKVLDLGANACDRNVECSGCDHFVADPSNLKALTAKVHQLRITVARLEGQVELEHDDESEMRLKILRIDLERWKLHLSRLMDLIDSLSPSERNSVMLAADVIDKSRTSNRINLAGLKP